MNRSQLSVILCACLLLGTAWSADPKSADAVTNAPPDSSSLVYSKALGYLEKEGQRWMDRRGCVSCHQIPGMLWSFNDANTAGLNVPSQELKDWNRWATLPVNFVKPERKKGFDVQDTLAANIDTMAGLLLAIPKSSDTDDANDWRETFAAKLCSEQTDNGSWKPCGQLPAQKRPEQETAQATTLWVTLALLRDGVSDFDLDSAIEFADRSPKARSLEWYAVRVLVAGERHSASLIDELQTKILTAQKDDGGWGWLLDDESDALATGLALYALAETGVSKSPEISRAREFLMSTQQASGAWKVPGTKKSTKGKPTPTSNYWGTAWAVVGLLSTE